VGQGTVVDLGRAFMGAPTAPGIQEYESHDITRSLRSVTTAFPASRPIVVAQTPPAGVTVTPLMKTSERSWAETDAKKIQYDGKDLKGPITLAAVATKDLTPTPPPDPTGKTPPPSETGGKVARLVVFGSTDFAGNLWTQLSGGTNAYLALSAINWLAEESALVNIPPRDDQPERVMLSDAQTRTLQILNFLAIPGLALAAGVFVWWKRR
jgi:ABC-type uncharacterized transport system involved in gliding motility auxiliary subunit